MFPLRTLLRPLILEWRFSLLVLVNLTIGLGLVCVTFSIVDKYLFRPLPVADPASVVHVKGTVPSGALSHPQYDDVRRLNEVFTGLAGFERQYGMRLQVGTELQILNGYVVSDNYFRVLGVEPFLGRSFGPEDATRDQVIVLSHRLWKSAFGSSNEILGQAVQINDHAYRVIGIADAGFTGTIRHFTPDFWLLRDQFVPEWRLNHRDMNSVAVLGRLKPGISAEQAQRHLAPITDRLKVINPNTDSGMTLSVLTDLDRMFADNRSAAFQYVAIEILSLLLLVIAVFNVNSLWISRLERKRQDTAIRQAIGARPRTIIFGYFLQAELLALLACGLGILFSFLFLHAFRGILFREDARIMGDLLTIRSLGLILVICLLTGLACAVVTSLRTSQRDLTKLLKGRSASIRGSRLGWGMVVLQIGLSFMLMATGGIMVKSLRNAWTMDAGFSGQNLLLLRFRFNHFSSLNNDQRIGYYRQLRTKFESLPGVVSVGWGSQLPLDGSGWSKVYANGHDPATAADACTVNWIQVGPGFFEAIGVPVLYGRAFDETDLDKTREDGEVIVNEAFVRRFFDGENPVGIEIYPWNINSPSQRVAGVVADFKTELNQKIDPQIITPASGNTAVWFIRASRDPDYLKGDVMGILKDNFPDIPLSNVYLKTYAEHLRGNFTRLNAGAITTGMLGLIGLSLTSLGVFGILLQWVIQHRREVAIRIALGATRIQIVAHVFKRATWQILLGTGIGLVAAYFGGHYMADVLYEVPAWDPPVILLSLVIQMLVLLFSISLPAWRASTVQAARVLDEE